MMKLILEIEDEDELFVCPTCMTKIEADKVGDHTCKNCGAKLQLDIRIEKEIGPVFRTIYLFPEPKTNRRTFK